MGAIFRTSWSPVHIPDLLQTTPRLRGGVSVNTLLIVSEPDIASTIQGDALLLRGGWHEEGEVEGGKS